MRTTDRASSAADRGEDQTDRLENQKSREVRENNQMFNLPDVEFERKVRGEILQTRFSIQKSVEEERMDLSFERKVLDQELADLLQNHPSRFSKLAVHLLERKVRDPILPSVEEEQENRF